MPSGWLRWACSFFDRSSHQTSMPLIANHSGRIDLARSAMISDAKRNPQYDWLIMMDTDVKVHDTEDNAGPAQLLDGVVHRLEHCRVVYGFDAVGGSVMDAYGVPAWGASMDIYLTLDGQTPFEVDWVAGGFFAMSRKAIDAIKPNGQITGRGVPVKDKDGVYRIPPTALFCRMLEKVTEDADLCDNLKRCGVKVGVDPCLIVGHEKRADFYMQRGEWDRFRKNAIEARERRLLNADA